MRSIIPPNFCYYSDYVTKRKDKNRKERKEQKRKGTTHDGTTGDGTTTTIRDQDETTTALI